LDTYEILSSSRENSASYGSHHGGSAVLFPLQQSLRRHLDREASREGSVKITANTLATADFASAHQVSSVFDDDAHSERRMFVSWLPALVAHSGMPGYGWGSQVRARVSDSVLMWAVLVVTPGTGQQSVQRADGQFVAEPHKTKDIPPVDRQCKVQA
jgi:hypothetical protein